MSGRALALGLLLGAVGFSAASAPKAVPDIRIYRLDCGRGTLDKNLFSDVHAYPDGAQISLVIGCYLIRHGGDLLLWDTGLGPDMIGSKGPATLDQRLEPQLAKLGVAPGDVKFVGVSHYHADHVGQAKSFPQARLLIGAREFDALFGPAPTAAEQAKPLQNWADGKNVEKIVGDHDVFGDGTVTTLALPGHTPGHMALLVRLKNAGPIILSGDQYHFAENRANKGVPTFNWDRADTVASSDRMEGLVRNLNAQLVIQHEPADVAPFATPKGYLD